MDENNSLYPDYAIIEDNIPTQIIEVRNVLKKEHNIIVPESCNNFIARCLRIKDGDLSKATKLVHTFYLISAEIRAWNIKLQPSCYNEHFYSLNLGFTLVTRDSSRRRIICLTVRTWDTKKVSCEELIVADWMLAQYILAGSPEDQRHGIVVIWDFAGTTLEQIWSFKQRRLLSIAKWYQTGAIGRVKGIHVVNHPRICNLIYAGIKPLLSEKTKRRFFFHRNLESLHKHFDTKDLPECLGGERKLEDCKDQKFMNELINSDKYFQDMAQNQFPSA